LNRWCIIVKQGILIGRLTKDPELRYTPANGVAVATFTLAVDRPFANQQGEREADFIPVVVWRKQAENCANYLNKAPRWPWKAGSRFAAMKTGKASAAGSRKLWPTMFSFSAKKENQSPR
jgi:hypothetical protein